MPRGQYVKKKNVERVCKVCGKDFLACSASGRYCSDRCMIDYVKEQNRARKRRNYLREIDKWKKYHEEYHNKYGWRRAYYSAKRRCNNPECPSYKYYGAKGIKLLMTMKEFKYLWFRDNAKDMAKPSIDRINPDKSYTLENCRFIEFVDNMKRVRTHSKLIEIQVKDIRKRKGFSTANYLSGLYNVTPSTIRNIWRGKTWKSLAQAIVEDK